MVSKPAADVRLAFPEVGDEELAEIAAVLETGHLTMGPKVEEFESLLAAAAGTQHAAAVSSGTAALHVAVRTKTCASPIQPMRSSRCGQSVGTLR